MTTSDTPNRKEKLRICHSILDRCANRPEALSDDTVDHIYKTLLSVQQLLTEVSSDTLTLDDKVDIVLRDDRTCYLCGAKPAKDLTLDHVIPTSRGGSHDPDNRRVACRACNELKSDRTQEECEAQGIVFKKGGDAQLE
jgi:5-methylcytosine-specific restriction endonuclease McrA